MLRKAKKLISLILCPLLIFQQTGLAQAVSLNLSNYLSQTPKPVASDTFRPLHLRYLSYDNLNQDFKLLLDKGDFLKESPGHQVTKSPEKQEKALENETQNLLRYFFIGLALPNDKFWVNLRPDSPDDILDPDLEKTDIGRIFLEADVQLKKDTAGFTSPQTPEGKAYWDKLYQKAGELFGTENITIPTLTRPWIVPNEIIIREAPDNAYIYKATLKVMLEEDYLKSPSHKVTKSPANLEQYSFKDVRLQELNEYSTQLIKELIIPKLTYQVNTSKRYAPLRQVYYSLILAQWFKQKFKDRDGSFKDFSGRTVPAIVQLIDSGSLTSNFQPLTSQQPYSKEFYFQQYQKSFKDGEYNLTEPIYSPYGQSIRRYMSGGASFANIYLSASPVVGSKEILKKLMGNVNFIKSTVKIFFAGLFVFSVSINPVWGGQDSGKGNILTNNIAVTSSYESEYGENVLEIAEPIMEDLIQAEDYASQASANRKAIDHINKIVELTERDPSKIIPNHIKLCVKLQKIIFEKNRKFLGYPEYDMISASILRFYERTEELKSDEKLRLNKQDELDDIIGYKLRKQRREMEEASLELGNTLDQTIARISVKSEKIPEETWWALYAYMVSDMFASPDNLDYEFSLLKTGDKRIYSTISSSGKTPYPAEVMKRGGIISQGYIKGLIDKNYLKELSVLLEVKPSLFHREIIDYLFYEATAVTHKNKLDVAVRLAVDKRVSIDISEDSVRFIYNLLKAQDLLYKDEMMKLFSLLCQNKPKLISEDVFTLFKNKIFKLSLDEAQSYFTTSLGLKALYSLYLLAISDEIPQATAKDAAIILHNLLLDVRLSTMNRHVADSLLKISEKKPELLATGEFIDFYKYAKNKRSAIPGEQVRAIYTNEHFIKQTVGYNFQNRYSIALATFRLMQRFSISDISRAVDFIIAKHNEYADYQVLGSDRDVILIVSGGQAENQDVKRLTQRLREKGVRNLQVFYGFNPDSLTDLQGFEKILEAERNGSYADNMEITVEPRSAALEAITNISGPTTIIYAGHGYRNTMDYDNEGRIYYVYGGVKKRETMYNGKHYRWKETMDLSHAAFILSRDISEALGSSKLKDLSQVLITSAGCYHYDFAVEMYDYSKQYLSKKGIISLPLFISGADKGKEAFSGIGATFITPPGLKSTFGKAFNKEDDWSDENIFFVPVRGEEIKNYFPQGDFHPKEKKGGDKQLDYLEIGSSEKNYGSGGIYFVANQPSKIGEDTTSSSAVMQLAETVADKLVEDYSGDGMIREFLKKGEINVSSEKISLSQYLTKIGIELSNIKDWGEFIEEVWRHARLRPDELQEKVKRELEKQEGLLSKGIKDIPVDAIEESHLYTLAVIDDARRIGESASIRIAPELIKNKAKMNEYVELPAQRLVRSIFKNGGNPYSSNAYGPGLKGVFWRKDEVDYFTPLTIEDYDFIALEQEKFGQIKIPEAWAGSMTGDVKTFSSVLEKKGGIAFDALPIRTEAVASSVLGSFSGVKAFQGDLDAEWAQIQAVFNAGVRPSVQRISEYTAAVADRGGTRSAPADEKIDQVRGMLADILRRDEEDKKLSACSADLKNLVTALES